MNLNYFFKPRAVAIIGASTDKDKIGRQILDNIIKSGYQGAIYPINLKEKEIAGRRAFPSLENIPHKNFSSLLVIVAIPALFVLPEIEKCGRLGIKNIIIISAGFKESDRDGKIREKNLLILAEHYKLNILGPNCLGFINNIFSLNASFAGSGLGGGQIALLSQSGAIGSAVLDWLKERQFNVGYFVSLGNKAVLDENSFLPDLVRDQNIKAIIVYLEEIRDGQKFMELASKISPRKPVVVLKAGTSEHGQEVAKSHTGALAGTGVAVKAGLERSGVIAIESLEELFDLLILLQTKAAQISLSGGLQILTNAGGLAVLSVDEISRQKLDFKGSVDVLGDADAKKYELALTSLLKKKSTDSILVLLTPQTGTKALETAEVIVRAAQKYPKRLIMVSFVGGEAVRAGKALMIGKSLPVFDHPERAIRTFRKIIVWQKAIQELAAFTKSGSLKAGAKTDYLSLFALLHKYKISTLKTLAFKPEMDIAYPVVLKAVGPDFLHKAEKKAIILNLKNISELKKAAAALKSKHKRAFQNQDNYLVVQPQLDDALEMILGFKRDESFGPVILLGLGGIYAEVFKEYRLAIADLNKERAYKLIKSLSFFPILNGIRGGRPYDLSQLADILVAISLLAREHAGIQEFDINPLFLKGKNIWAGDARAIIQ